MSEAVTIDTIKNILTKNVNKEYSLSREEAIAIMNLPEDDMPLLMEMAGSLRKKYKGNHVSIHLLTNARSGNCSQNCAYCAQSCRSKAEIEKYKLFCNSMPEEKERGTVLIIDGTFENLRVLSSQ